MAEPRELKNAKKFYRISMWCFALAFLVFVFGHLIEETERYRYPSPAEYQNAAITLYYAAQQYLTENYAKTGELKYDVTIQDLVDAKLLISAPKERFGEMTITVLGLKTDEKGNTIVDVKTVVGGYVYPLEP